MKLRYETYIDKITESLEKYKRSVDSMAKNYIAEVGKVKETALSHKDQWLPEYIEQYIAEHNPQDKYKRMFDSEREKYKPIVTHYLALIKQSLDNYFNAPISRAFADKIMTIKAVGLQLTDREFRNLEKDASNYMEYRLLKELANSRTKKEDSVELDEKGNTKLVKKEVDNPYLKLKLPDADAVYNSFEEYERNANMLLNSYAGAEGALCDMLGNADDIYKIPKHIAITSDSYLRNKSYEKFLNVMNSATSIMPENKVKRTLTDNDKKLIDALVDSNYPSLASSKVAEICKNSPELAELFLLDERYEKYAAKALLDV